jgi:hypothetical protein
MVLKTSYLETRYMMNQTADGKLPVMSVVAFRSGTLFCAAGRVPL